LLYRDKKNKTLQQAGTVMLAQANSSTLIDTLRKRNKFTGITNLNITPKNTITTNPAQQHLHFQALRSIGTIK